MFSKVIFSICLLLLAYYWQTRIKQGPLYYSEKTLEGKTVLMTGKSVCNILKITDKYHHKTCIRFNFITLKYVSFNKPLILYLLLIETLNFKNRSY